MELRQYLSIAGKWLWLVVLSVLIAAGASYAASRAATPLYRTRTSLMVGRTTQNPDPNSSEIYTGQQLAYTYMQLARREPVLKGAIKSLGLQMSWEVLAAQVSTNIVQQTQLIEIAVIDNDPYRAKVLADAIAQQLILESPTGANTTAEETAFIKSQMSDLKKKIEGGQADIERFKQERDAANSALQIQDLQSQIDLLETKISGWQNTYSQLLTSLQGGNINALSVVEEATIPTQPISPNTKMNVLLAAAIGLILAVGGVFLIEYLDDTVKTTEDVERITELPTIGNISRIPGNKYSEKLISARSPLDPAVEAFRVLRSNIQYSSVDKPIHTLLMTSSGPSEGKSVCLANLAVVMAQSDMRVILVDADLRRPMQNEIFCLQNYGGLIDAVLYNHQGVGSYLQNTDVDHLRVLTTGQLPPNPAKILGSERMKEIIEELKFEADIVLFDSPPILAVADAVILGTQLDGVVLLTDADRTRIHDIQHAVQEMRQVKANLLGVVFNQRTQGRGKSYYNYYYSKGTNNKKATIWEKVKAFRVRKAESE